MKKRNKFLALLLVLVMTASLAACGTKATDETPTAGQSQSTNDNKESTDAAKETETTETNTTETAEATPEVPESVITGDTSREDAFYVYCWNTDVQNNVINYFTKFYPEYADRIVYVDCGGSNFYQQKIDPLLQDPSNPQYPDLFAVEMDYIMKYTASDYTMDVADLGITEADMANMYPYTIQAATVEGAVKALSWQAAPGAMMYRRSLAKEYLGTDDPAEVQKYFSDWNTMVETGKTILSKSNGETKLFSGVDDVKRVYQASRETAWYDESDTLVVEQTMLDYMDFAKVLYDNGLTNNTTQWSEAWSANAATDNTFAYMGCTWFLHWCLKAYSGGTTVGEGTYGDWAMTAGPQPYYWGGTWLTASSHCSDPELAGLIMKAATCNTEIMKDICLNTLDYVNNKQAIAELIAEGAGAYEFLGGQDFLAYFAPLAEKIELPAMCGEDFYITLAFDNQVTEYTGGRKTKEQAVEDFKSAVIDLYPYLQK